MAENRQQYYYPPSGYPHHPYYYQPAAVPPGEPWVHGPPPVVPEVGQKRSGDDDSGQGPSKRSRAGSESSEADEDDTGAASLEDNGVPDDNGPSSAGPSSQKSRRTHLSKQVATDVWRFVRPLTVREKPDGWVPPTEEDNQYTKPDVPFVGCRLCTHWKVWKCIVGMTTTIRNHLRNEHAVEYERICREENLKYAGSPTASSSGPLAPPIAPPPYAYATPYPPGFAYQPVGPPHPPHMQLPPPPVPPASSGLAEPIKKGTATDVWRFLRPLTVRERPPNWEPPQDEPVLTRKPDTPFLGCKLCVENWRVWKCMDGMTSTIRIHLHKQHRAEYDRICSAEGLKVWNPPPRTPHYPSTRGPIPGPSGPPLPHLLQAVPMPPPPPSPAMYSPVPPTPPSGTHYQHRRDRSVYASNAVATDVWYFMRGLETREKPENWKEPETETLLERKPNTPFLGCKLCSARGQWRTWKCMNGMSSTIRKHLHNEHQSEYNDACRSLQLKGSSLVPDAAEEDEEAPDYPMTDVKEPTPPPVDPTPASAVDKAKTPTPVVASTTTKPRGRPRNTIPMEPFYDRLVRFIVTSGLPLDVVDSSYFRDLLLFSAGKFIDETKFPNHAKICQLIADRFMAERTRISEDFKNASGRISFTIDIQAEPCPRVVVTAHYCSLNENDTLSVQSRLVAIRRLPRHRAEQDETSRAAQQALVIFDALKSYDVLSKVGAITVADNLLDGRLPEELGKLFAQEGISFNPTFSFSRNLPPAIHDAVEAGLHVLAPTSSSKIDKASASEVPLYNPTLIANKEYTEALENDPVSCIRGIVSAARDSAERRQQLRLLITEEDISANELDADEAVDGVMRSRELLHDDGRWSSTYVMIERALALYPGIERFLKETTQGDVAELALDDADIQVLNDIKEFLRVPFTVHDIVGEERLPLLTTAVPLYEQLLVFLRRIQDTIPEIAHGVSVTLAKLNEYFGKARSNRTYALAMAINPTAKFKWAEDNWTPEQRDQARQWMFDAMLEHYQKLHSVTPTGQGDASATPLPQPTKSATKSLSAMERLMQLSSDRRGSSSSSRPSQPTAGSVSATSPSESSDSGDSKKKEAEKEKAAIDNELRRYIAEGVLDSQEDLDDFNIMQYWKDNAKRFPLMYLVALDVLPTQVSVIPSNKLLPTSDIANFRSLTPDSEEMIQMLKFVYAPEKLDFTVGWIAKEDELFIEPTLSDKYV